jgi:hypothetical protein
MMRVGFLFWTLAGVTLGIAWFAVVMALSFNLSNNVTENENERWLGYWALCLASELIIW